MFTFGAGMYGQLGHNSSSSEALPKKVFELMGSEVCQIACGRLVSMYGGVRMYSPTPHSHNTCIERLLVYCFNVCLMYRYDSRIA